MRKLLPYLYTSEIKVFRYYAPIGTIKEKIDAIFNISGKFLSEPDFNGRFTSNNTFEMSINSGAVTTGNVKFGSILHGRIYTDENGETLIETTTKARYIIKLIAMASALIGSIYLIKSITDYSLQYLLWAVGFLLLAPLLCNWLAGVLNATIQERFKVYIDTKLTKVNTPNTQF